MCLCSEFYDTKSSHFSSLTFIIVTKFNLNLWVNECNSNPYLKAGIYGSINMYWFSQGTSSINHDMTPRDKNNH